jgi:16S rRNA (cytidine1402-2'-O)-methyltransferase
VTTGPGTLYVIATPIGNMDDISVRARNLLGSVDLVAAEDTRRAGQLLTRLGIRNSLLSLHEHNESQRIDGLLAGLAEGRSLALISDAGTPLISDPGYRLLSAARQRGIPVSPVPGSCAAIATLSVAGLASDRFRFEGFLPARAGPRSTRLEALGQCADTMIFYESVHRIKATLAAMEKAFGEDRPATLARELTKLHETLYRGTLSEVRQQLDADPGGEKGELTLVVAGVSEPTGPERQELERVLGVLLAELSHKQASALAARITGVSRREAYEVARLLREES